MKKSRYTLFAAWLLLLCFMAGQAIVYTHQHHALKYTGANHHTDTGYSIAEKCQLCDTMHHTDMMLMQNHFIVDLKPAMQVHPVLVYNFKSFGLILAGGRSPPVFIIS